MVNAVNLDRRAGRSGRRRGGDRQRGLLRVHVPRRAGHRGSALGGLAAVGDRRRGGPGLPARTTSTRRGSSWGTPASMLLGVILAGATISGVGKTVQAPGGHELAVLAMPIIVPAHGAGRPLHRRGVRDRAADASGPPGHPPRQGAHPPPAARDRPQPSRGRAPDLLLVGDPGRRRPWRSRSSTARRPPWRCCWWRSSLVALTLVPRRCGGRTAGGGLARRGPRRRAPGRRGARGGRRPARPEGLVKVFTSC